jgi:choice-of-anchor B domain-containing protein
LNIQRNPFVNLLLTLVVATSLSAQTSLNVDFLGNKNDYPQPNGALGYSACWGYTAPDGREYAILGTLNGTSIIDITDAPTLREVSFIPGPSSSWREMKTYRQYAFIVTENGTAAGAGLQIVDLSALPSPAKLARTYVWVDTVAGTPRPFPNVHSVSVSENFLYLNGGGSNGIRILDIHDPLNPVQVGKYSTTYVHDSHIRRDTIFASTIGSNGLDIVDARNKSNPVLIKRIQYVGSGTHNAWTTPDRKFVITTDEVGTTNKSLKFWDIRTISNPSMVAEFTNTISIVHNVFVKGNLAYVAWYADGLKVIDISNPLSPQMVGFYDTYPGNPVANYVGAWGADPYFPSGKVIISDMQTGLYVVRYTGDKRGIVSGAVTDAATGAPLADVLLHFKDAAITRFSGSNGQYLFGYAPGKFDVTIEKPGYVTKQQTLTVVEGATTTVNLTLTNAATAVEQATSPQHFSLSQNYPNPFNPSTTINFTLDREENVVLKVFNLYGDEVRVLVNDRRSAGNYHVSLDGTMLPSGVYYYQLTAGGRASAGKMVLMK